MMDRDGSLHCQHSLSSFSVISKRRFRSLTSPGVPSLIPNELGSLQGLQSLQIIGDNAIPGMYLLLLAR